MAKIIRWTNKYSEEQGYVQSIIKAEGHFVNTYDPAEAKVYKRQSDITKALNVLALIGEGDNNYFDVIDI